MKKILITGATGQIGTELILELRKKYGVENVIAVGHSRPASGDLSIGPFESCDVTNLKELETLFQKHSPDTIFHLVGILSATGEKNPDLAWNVNMNGLKNVLDLSLKYSVKKIFWPSSIASFGPNTPKENTPQHTILEPTTMYGVTKVAGELLCQYYFKKYNLDIRSIRYPGIISYKTLPGGGTTDYAVAVYFEALEKKSYEFFVNEDTVLPMMYMPDAVSATIDLMEAPIENISIRTSYNLTAMSFSAKELAEEVKKHIPDFAYSFNPDSRQEIANSWPKSIDDSFAKKDFNWIPKYDLTKMSEDMIENIKALNTKI